MGVLWPLGGMTLLKVLANNAGFLGRWLLELINPEGPHGRAKQPRCGPNLLAEGLTFFGTACIAQLP